MNTSELNGIYITYRGDYDSTVTDYVTNNTVHYDSAIWIATTEVSAGSAPALDNTDWFLLRQDSVPGSDQINEVFAAINSDSSNAIATDLGVTNLGFTSNVSTTPDSDNAFILRGITLDEIAALSSGNILYWGFIEITLSTEYNLSLIHISEPTRPY